MFDTHCHLNFKAFDTTVETVINEASKAGVTHMVVPGTDIETSRKAAALAHVYPNIYAAVGIHPHHAKEFRIQNLELIINLLQQPKVIAIGEVGLDKHVYEQTKYQNYHINGQFLTIQKELLIAQIQLALTYKKTLILHCRESASELLDLLTKQWDTRLENRTVFHCCEANDALLDFAKTHHIFIGIDGDVTFDLKKQEFIKKVPLEMLVLETDSPYLLPEPQRSAKKYPNKPSNIPIIASFVAKLMNKPHETIAKQTSLNGRLLFRID